MGDNFFPNNYYRANIDFKWRRKRCLKWPRLLRINTHRGDQLQGQVAVTCRIVCDDLNNVHLNHQVLVRMTQCISYIVTVKYSGLSVKNIRMLLLFFVYLNVIAYLSSLSTSNAMHSKMWTQNMTVICLKMK